MNDWKEARIIIEKMIKIPNLVHFLKLPESVKNALSTALKAIDIVGKVEADVDINDIASKCIDAFEGKIITLDGEQVEECRIVINRVLGKVILSLLAQKEKRIYELEEVCEGILKVQDEASQGKGYDGDPNIWLKHIKAIEKIRNCLTKLKGRE